MEPDELYGLPLERFVPERGALVKELRAAGRRADADAAAALRKPTVAAWAVNQLVRTQSKLVKTLFEAGDALRAAQDELLAGRGDARKLRQAAERERTAVDALAERGRGLLTGEGDDLSPAVLERVGETLHAAALDETAREEVQDGRLVRELRHAGLGFGDATPLPTAPRRKAGRGSATAKPGAKPGAKADRGSTAAKSPAADAKPSAAERRAAAVRARAEQDRIVAERKAARMAQAAARKRAERAARALKVAQERRDRAAAALEEAEAALDAAVAEAEAAQTELENR